MVDKHAGHIASGSLPFPILEAEGATIVQVWHHLRLEACIPAVRFGLGSLYDLANPGMQPEALAEFIDRKAHLQFPQPSGTPVAQSVQGMWQAYAYLMEAGAKVGDPATDKFLLRAGRRSVLEDLEREAGKSQVWWQSDSADGLAPTLFELFLDDLNRKTKSIAMACRFGPSPAEGAAAAIEEARTARGDGAADQMGQLIEALEASNNPDEAIERTKDLPIAGYF